MPYPFSLKDLSCLFGFMFNSPTFLYFYFNEEILYNSFATVEKLLKKVFWQKSILIHKMLLTWVLVTFIDYLDVIIV